MLTLKPPRLLTLLLLGAIALTACAGQPEPPPAAGLQPRPASATSAPINAPTSAPSSKPTVPAPTL